MNKIIIFGALFLAFSILLSGCTDSRISDESQDLSKFFGVWEGNMEFSMFGGRENFSSSNITMLEFTENTLYMTITTLNGTQTMSNTYKVEGDKLSISFQFSGERPHWDMPLNDSFQPPFNSTQQPPFNNSEIPPFNGTQRPPFNGEMPSRENSYTFRFNENYDILYLNNSEFKKLG